jgi:hypothetical protein
MAKKKISNKAPKPSFRNGAVIRTERGGQDILFVPTDAGLGEIHCLRTTILK